MAWVINVHPAVEQWFLDLTVADPDCGDAVERAVEELSLMGPGLARPLADRISGSRHHNMKELRPITPTGRVRILYCFDPDREAILLVAGDKTGAWNEWYRTHISIADDRYDAYLKEKESP